MAQQRATAERFASMLTDQLAAQEAIRFASKPASRVAARDMAITAAWLAVRAAD